MGVINLTPDSFSDGGLYDAPAAALAHAEQLVADGASAVDVGAVSSNPDGVDQPADVELARLRPVLRGLRERQVRTSVDSFSPAVQVALAAEVDWLNDIRGFPDPSVWPALADARCGLIVMHAVQRGRADHRHTRVDDLVDRICAFFDERLAALAPKRP